MPEHGGRRPQHALPAGRGDLRQEPQHPGPHHRRVRDGLPRVSRLPGRVREIVQRDVESGDGVSVPGDHAADVPDESRDVGAGRRVGDSGVCGGKDADLLQRGGGARMRRVPELSPAAARV